jgi:hypothetical protein
MMFTNISGASSGVKRGNAEKFSHQSVFIGVNLWFNCMGPANTKPRLNQRLEGQGKVECKTLAASLVPGAI